MRNIHKNTLIENKIPDIQKQIDFSKKNFVVLHLRANHSPYETYTPPSFIKKDYSSEETANKLRNRVKLMI